MIKSAEEFVAIRVQNDQRATEDNALESVWLDVIERFPEFREWVAHNKTVPVSVLTILANDTDARVRFTVAMKRKCPPDILEKLAKDADETVRVRVAVNAKTPPEVLHLLRMDSSKLVADALATRSQQTN